MFPPHNKGIGHAHFILHLGQQNRLAFKVGARVINCPRAVGLRFPNAHVARFDGSGFCDSLRASILWFNLFACINARLKRQIQTAIRIFRLYHLCIHQITPYTF